MRSNMLMAAMSAALIGLVPTHAQTPQGGEAGFIPQARPAEARLSPERLYNGFNRDIPMLVTLPEQTRGEVAIALFDAGATEARETRPVTPGRVNLAALFPSLWTEAQPPVRYAQLTVGGERIGPPVVLQPMLTPKVAVLVDRTTRQPTTNPRGAAIEFSLSQGPTYSGLRAYIDQFVVLDTSHGEIVLSLRPDVAPNTVWNFRQLVAGGFYTGVIFHRIVPRLPNGHPFVVQAGDPTGTGMGGPGYMIDLEPSKLPHDFGVISMARTPEPNSAGSQFFLCLSREGTSFLDREYCAFGQAVAGADAIVRISQVDLQGERPVDPPTIRTARLVDAPPWGTGRDPVKRPATEPTPR
jgi:peptidyl-prolyl cis-trans isomerase B (cyclophilin B)